MLDRSNGLILGVAVLAAAIGGYAQFRGQQSPVTESPLIGQQVPAITLPDLDGKPHPLSEYLGHRVVLNFWASWCGPCLEEMPALDQAATKFGEHEPIVVGIAMDEPPRIRAFLAAHPVSYPILLGRPGAPSTTLILGDTSEVLPYSVLIDANGRISATHEGILSALQLEQWLRPVHGRP